jgi:hypothetical protein
VRIGQLKAEPPAQAELDGLVRSGRVRLADAENASLSLESRFDLAYNAAHALSLAALRWHGQGHRRGDGQPVRPHRSRTHLEAGAVREGLKRGLAGFGHARLLLGAAT